MKFRIRSSVLLLLLFSLIASSCTGNQVIDNRISSINNSVSNLMNFSLNTEDINLQTSVFGTIYIKKQNSQSPNIVEIVAWISVDPDDWAGVQFLIPKELVIRNISTSYPNGDLNAEEFVTVWYNDYYKQHEPGYTTMINILGSEEDDNTTRVGSIVIELEFIEKTMPDSIDVVVGAGSKGKDLLYPCFETINVPTGANS